MEFFYGGTEFACMQMYTVIVYFSFVKFKFKCYDVTQIFINVEFAVYAVHSDFSLTPPLINDFSLCYFVFIIKKTRSKMYTTCSDHAGIFRCYWPKSWYSACSSVKPIIFLNQQN